MRRVKLGGIKRVVGQHLDGCPGWAAQLDCYREMQRFVTVTIVAPLTYSVAVTPRSERVGFNSQRSWAFIPSRSFERCAAAAALGQTQALKFGRE
jgi:hypothetical protein